MITFAVIHCNRLYYLKNCVRSILEFVTIDDINLLVIDNGSTEPGVSEYLSHLPKAIDVKIFKGRSPNELHRAMNYAIQYSKNIGNKYVNFIQDDYQYLYRCPDLIHKVIEAFESDQKVMQLQTNMVWRRKIDKIGRISKVIINDEKWFYLKDKYPCDNGFTRVALFKKIGLYPENTSIHGKENGYLAGESWISRKCSKRNWFGRRIPKYKVMLLAESNMGMLMDCAYVRGMKRIGKYIPAPNKYYLKPIGEDKISLIKQLSDKDQLCFIEDVIEPDGWTPETSGKHSIRDEMTQL